MKITESQLRNVIKGILQEAEAGPEEILQNLLDQKKRIEEDIAETQEEIKVKQGGINLFKQAMAMPQGKAVAGVYQEMIDESERKIKDLQDWIAGRNSDLFLLEKQIAKFQS